MLYTASLNRRADHHGLTLDVTVKSARPENRVFAPTWEMVMGVKDGRLAWHEYVARYRALLRGRWDDPASRRQLVATALTAVRTDVTILCYCPSPVHCHRSLLAEVLQQVAKAQGKELQVVLR